MLTPKLCNPDLFIQTELGPRSKRYAPANAGTLCWEGGRPVLKHIFFERCF